MTDPVEHVDAPRASRHKRWPSSSAWQPRHALLAIAALTLFSALLLAGLRTYALERTEQDHEGAFVTIAEARKQPSATKVSVRLTEVSLAAYDDVLFELCSRDPLAAKRWAGKAEIAILRLAPAELMLKVPLDPAHLKRVQRNAEGACLQLGSGTIEHTGKYSVDVVYPDAALTTALKTVPLRARVLARHPLTAWDNALVLLLAFGVLLLLLGLWLRAPAQATAAPRRPLLAATGALVALALAAQLPMWGATLGLAKGLLLALVQVTLAITLCRPTALLSLQRPRRPARAIGMALVAGLLLSQNAKLWLRVIPSTGTAPVETFISWPSGMLAFATLGIVLPLAEELFFRGFLYRALLPLGRSAAFALSLSAFVLLHVQQSFGNWGSLLSIFGTGLVLTTLRVATGSTLVPALTHVIYNLLLSLASL